MNLERRTQCRPDHGARTQDGEPKSSGGVQARACGRRRSTSATSSSTITSPITATRASSPVRPSGRSAIWKKLTDLFVEERKKGVLDVSQIPSSITAHDAGYIDKENEVIVGLQTDAPLKRAIMPNGGLKMVTNGARGLRLQAGSARSSRSSPSIARPTTTACSTPTPATSASAAARTS